MSNPFLAGAAKPKCCGLTLRDSEDRCSECGRSREELKKKEEALAPTEAPTTASSSSSLEPPRNLERLHLLKREKRNQFSDEPSEKRSRRETPPTEEAKGSTPEFNDRATFEAYEAITKREAAILSPTSPWQSKLNLGAKFRPVTQIHSCQVKSLRSLQSLPSLRIL